MGVLIAGVCFYVNSSVVSATRQNLLDANINRLGVLRVQHEERLAALLDVGNQISQSPYVTPFRFSDDPMGAFRLKQHLAAFTAAAGMCDQMYVIFDQDEYLYSMLTSVSLPMLTERMLRLENTAPERLEAFIRNAGDEPELLPVQKASSVLVNNADIALMVAPLRLAGRSHIGSVMFVIRDAAYQAMFADSVYEHRNMYIVYNGKVLSAARRFDDVADDVVLRVSENTLPVQSVVEDGVRYLLFSQKGALLGMRYISLIPEAAVKMQTAQSLYAFVGFLFLIFIPCLLLAVSFSRRFERPIHELRDSLAGGRGDLDAETGHRARPGRGGSEAGRGMRAHWAAAAKSAGRAEAADGAGARGDHFDVIRSGIEKLEAQNSLLHRRLDDSLTARSADFVKNFIKLRFRARGEALEAALALGSDIDRARYAVILASSASAGAGAAAAAAGENAGSGAGMGSGENAGLYADTGAGADTQMGMGSGGNAGLYADTQMGMGAGAGSGFCAAAGAGLGAPPDGVTLLQMETVERGQRLFLAFADEPRKIEDWARAMGALRLDADADAVIATSGVHADFAEAGAAYLEASTAFDNRFVVSTDQLLRFEDVSLAATGISEYTDSFMEGFREALAAGDARAVHSRVNELMKVLGERRFSLFALRVIYNDIISALLNRYFDGADEKERLRLYDVFQLSKCRKTSDIVDILRRICGEILAREASGQPAPPQAREAELISRIGAYLRAHFDDPNLSLGAVANLFGVSAARLSQAFKEVEGLHPSDFLALLRMEKARDLLLDTDMPIRDIGTAVGYYDVTSFIRRFKRDMSLTPAQYRKANRAAGVAGALKE
jgi:two-component system response regulator YesN